MSKYVFLPPGLEGIWTRVLGDSFHSTFPLVIGISYTP